MRLKQLAKEVNVTAGLIETYLIESKGMNEITPNSKLDEETIEAICKNFKVTLQKEEPVVTETATAEEPKAVEQPKTDAFPNLRKQTEEVKEEYLKEQIEKTEEIDSSKEVTETKSEEPKILTFEERMQIEVPDVDQVPEDEVIKAPKVDLPGITVVDKIDLPEPKEVLEVAVKTGEHSILEAMGLFKIVEKKEKPSNKRRNKRKKNNKSKGPSLSEIRTEEARVEQEKEAERQKKLKEAKKKHYEENVLGKQQQKPKAKKKKEKSPEEIAAKKKKEATPEPTGIFGKFMRWLND